MECIRQIGRVAPKDTSWADKHTLYKTKKIAQNFSLVCLYSAVKLFAKLKNSNYAHPHTFYHVASILGPPLSVMVVWIIRLWPLQCLKDLWPHQTEPRLLGSMVQLNKSVLNLHSSTKLKQQYYKHPPIIHPLKYATKSPKIQHQAVAF